VQSQQPVQLSRARLNQIVRNLMFYRLSTDYSHIVSMFENRLELVENLMQIMHLTLIFHVQVLVTYISRAWF